MCTTVTSDGVIIDNSAPTAGAVQDGGISNNKSCRWCFFLIYYEATF
jgi:hypothetical protein